MNYDQVGLVGNFNRTKMCQNIFFEVISRNNSANIDT